MPDLKQRAIKASKLTQAEVDANDTILVKAKTLDYTVLVSDNNDTIECTITDGVITLPSVSTITNTGTGSQTGEFTVTLKNLDTTLLTITPNGGDTLETTSLGQNQCVTLQSNDAGDGWNTLSTTGSAFATGEITFSAVPSTDTSEDVTIVNSLGSDDIDFGFKFRSVTAQTSTAGMTDPSAFTIKQTEPSNAIFSGLTPTTPATGKIGIMVYNASGSPQDIIVHWWIRLR